VRKFDTDVLIKSESVIPIELIESSKSLGDILLSNSPFLLTAFIVISAATVTYRSNRQSVEKAKAAEHENKISEFRHHWLQEVRDTASNLIKVIHECQYFTMTRNLADDRQKAVDDETSKLEMQSIYDDLKESYSNLMKKRAEFYKHHAKLCLLFKKDEEETKVLFKKLSEIKSKMGDLSKRSLDDVVINEITEELQVILKTEWEATKDRTWLSNT